MIASIPRRSSASARATASARGRVTRARPAMPVTGIMFMTFIAQPPVHDKARPWQEPTNCRIIAATLGGRPWH